MCHFPYHPNLIISCARCGSISTYLVVSSFCIYLVIFWGSRCSIRAVGVFDFVFLCCKRFWLCAARPVTVTGLAIASRVVARNTYLLIVFSCLLFIRNSSDG